MSSKTWRNAISRRIHKERAQPSYRKQHGLLEKKKDYKKRAVDYHRKADHLKLLKEKAALKNPDEFYFAMKNSQLKDGIHTNNVEKRHKIDTVRRYTAQDIQYLYMKNQEEKKRIELLKGELHGITEPLPNTVNKNDNKRTIFVDSIEAFKNVETKAELFVNDKNNSDEEDTDNQTDVKLNKTQVKLKKKRKRRYAELAAREKRQKKIEEMIYSLEQKKNLINSKGQCIKKVKRDKFGDIIPNATVYKWKKDRKR